jgi:hypothetical protein
MVNLRSAYIPNPVRGRSSLFVYSDKTSAIRLSISVAEKEYVRFFDLFTGKYYLHNEEKRALAAKRYAILNKCNDLIQSQTYTIAEVFEAYKSFEVSTITHYNSFLRKIKEFRTIGATSCTHGRIGEKYEYKMNPYTNALVFQLLCDPHQFSYSKITEWVNSTLENVNNTQNTSFQPISKSTIAGIYGCNRNEIDYFRVGKARFDVATRPYFPRIKALDAGSLVQMDGSPIQLHCWNHPSKWNTKEGKKLIRPNLFVLRDAFSGKITGFDMSESEDRYNIIESLKMHVNIHHHLPAELVHDNFSASKTDEFKAIKKALENKGTIVRAAKVGNAQDKGEVERFFGTFQSRFQRLVDGYLGEGIRSKRVNGRISDEFIEKHRKDNGYYGYDEMLKIIAELVAIYNNSIISKKYGTKTPNMLYSESEKKHVKEVSNTDYIQMFWLNKTLKVNKSLLVNEIRGQKYYYEIWDNDLKLQLNGKSVRVYYDENDESEISVFSLEGEYICTCQEKTKQKEKATAS